jgi:CMP-N-acetylneuraminic acid synthetase
MRLALVPARGGSRTIPRKNVKPLGGRPLLEWSVGAIRASGAVEQVVVSTDDEEIARVAEAAGAAVLERPGELSRDETPSVDVVAHALGTLDASEWVLFVQPTEPFVTPEQIAAALALAEERDADSAITVVQVPRNYHPYHVRTEVDGFLEFDCPDEHYAHPSRQDDPPRYAFGNLYWFRREAFERERAVEPGRRVGYRIDPITALDLNTAEDWALAEAVVAAGLVERW